MRFVIEVVCTNDDKNRPDRLDALLAVAKSAILEAEESGQLLSPTGQRVSIISSPIESISGVVRLEG